MTYYQKKKAELRDKAIQWQIDFAEKVTDAVTLCADMFYFECQGRKYGLLKEFRENGIL